MEFMGHPMLYWIELQRRMNSLPDSLRSSALLQEVVDLRGLLSFYESRVEEMSRAKRKD